MCKTVLLKATFILDSPLESQSKISHKEEGPKGDSLQLMELQQSTIYKISWIIEETKWNKKYFKRTL